MLFNSVHFLIFFPIVTLLYFCIPHRLRWMWLLGASYYFYMCWNPKYALLIATSTLITYVSGILIHHANGLRNQKLKARRKKLWVFLSFASNLLILFFFKYFDFTLDNINLVLRALHIELIVPSFDVMLPVGISFYTFQALSYTMDVYREELPAERSLGRYALFVSFFPQLVAGPIERSKHLLGQMNRVHTFNYERMCRGLCLMLWGFFQKIVIADRIAILVNQVYNNYSGYKGFELIVATLLFAVQIYCDFSGYSDIAIGAAEVMGFELMENFRRPYFAKSIGEFWRRWHISLSTWFKDYLYIPLGGNRCSRGKWYRNIMIVFMASGLWHGASWNYVIWGGLHGLYQIVGDQLRPFREKWCQKLSLDAHPFVYKWLQMLITFALVDFAWIFFRAPSGRSALGIIKRMMTTFNPEVLWNGRLYELGLNASNVNLMLVGIGVLWLVNVIQEKYEIRSIVMKMWLPIRWLGYLALIFSILIFGIYGPGYANSQFIYFQF